MARWRFVLTTALGTLLALLLAAGFALQQVQATLQAHALSIDWQRWQLSWQGVTFEDVHIQQAQQFSAQAKRLELNWQPWYHIQVDHLSLSLSLTPDSPSAPEWGRNNSQWQTLLMWLPRQLSLNEASLSAPCPSGQCTLAFSAQLKRSNAAITLSAALPHAEHALQVNATLTQASENALRKLSASLQANPQTTIRLNAEFATGYLEGELQAPLRGELNWLRDWLGQWLFVEPRVLPETPAHADIQAQWHVPFNRNEPAEISAQLTLAHPWPFPEVGTLSGHAELHVLRELGIWQTQQLDAQLVIDPSAAPWMINAAKDLQPGPLTLALTTAQSNTLALQLSSQGPLTLSAGALLRLQAQQPLIVVVEQLNLSAHSPALDIKDHHLTGTALTLEMQGILSADHLELKFGKLSHLSAEAYHWDDLQLERLSAPLSTLTIQGSLNQPALSGPFTVSSAALIYPALHTQPLQWHGQLLASAQAQSLDGTLSTQGNMNLSLAVQHQPSQGLELAAHWQHNFAQANPLPSLFSQWPERLNLDSGLLNANLQVKASPKQAVQLNATLNAEGISGVYDRTDMQGISAALSAALSQDRLSAQLHSFTAQRIDPGVAFGPTQLRANYQASSQTPLAGELFIEQAHSTILEGQLQLPAAHINLAQRSHLLPLTLKGLNLGTLLTQYPAEGLSGSGLIDAHLPLRLGPGLSIENGQLDAQAPGGWLRFDSDKIRAFGQSNPAMQVVTHALENFHYNQLSSRLNYSPSGKLNLALRMHGQNPELEQGRAINFTINLEEDVPSLLASLQLSGKVSEVIKQRIQHNMHQRAP